MTSISPLFPLILATVFNIIGLGMVVPMLPFQVTSLGGEVGFAPLIFSSFSAAAFFGAPLWGWMSDQVGRKPVLLMSAFTTILSYLWLASADSLFDVYGSRIAAGLAAGWFAAAAALVADVTLPKDRAKGMGFLGAAFGLGFTLGPALGAWAVGEASTDFSLPALAAAVCATVSFGIALLFVQEPEGSIRKARVRFATAILKDRGISLLLCLHFTVHLVFTAMEGVFAVWAAGRFGLGAREVGFYLAFSGLVTVIVQGGIVRRVVPVFGEMRVIVFAVGMLCLTMITLLFVHHPLMVLLPMGLLAIGMGLHNPALQSQLSQSASPQIQGGAMGMAQSAQSLARIGGPAWGGAAFAAIGSDSPFLIGLVVLLIAFLFAAFLSRQIRSRENIARD